MSVHTDIRQALETAVITATGYPAAAYRAREGRRFNADAAANTESTWVRTTFIPNESRPAAMLSGTNIRKKYMGLFMVNVFVFEGKTNTLTEAETLADAIRDVFDPGGDGFTKNSTSIRIEYSERGQGLEDSPWFNVPVTVSWYSYRT